MHVRVEEGLEGDVKKERGGGRMESKGLNCVRYPDGRGLKGTERERMFSMCVSVPYPL